LKQQLRMRHPASRVTLLASSLAVLAAHSLAWGATDPPAWPETWSTTAAPVAGAPAVVEEVVEVPDVEVAEDGVPGVAAANGDAKPSAPCPELDDETPMLDQFRHGVERSVCVTAWRFDSLFGVLPEDQIVERRSTHGRLRLGVKWDERDGFQEEVALRAQVHLPIAERRMRLIFGRDTDEAFIEGGSREFDGVTLTEEDEERNWLLGLGYEPIRGTRSRLSLGAGVRLRTPPDPFVQASYWYQTKVHESLLLRARQTVFWENEDGFGTTTRVSLERLLAGRRMLRWANHLRISEATDGMRWNTNLTLYQALAEDRAIALRGEVRGETGRDVNPIEYNLRLIHRRSFLKEWLFLELQGGGGWLREEQEESREFVPQAAMIFEMALGRRPGTPGAEAP
jgi:hypothetical protein